MTFRARLISLIVVSTVFLFLFQNCSQMKVEPTAAALTSTSESNPQSSTNARPSNASIRYVEQFAGEDAGKKILAAIADLKAQGIKQGIVDATGLAGTQYINDKITLGTNWDSSYTLLLGHATFLMTKSIYLGRGSRIKGEAYGMWSWKNSNDNSTVKTTVLRAKTGAKISSALIIIGRDSTDGDQAGNGSIASVEGIIVDGNFDGEGTIDNAKGIWIDRAAWANISHVSIVSAAGSGLSVYSSLGDSGASNYEAALTVQHLMSAHNKRCGLEIINTNDVFVSQSQFEENYEDGICLTNSKAIRLSQSDLGGNGRHGIVLMADSSHAILTGNQFGNNRHHDLKITGGYGANVINGNQFIGSGRRIAPDVITSIYVEDSYNTTITGNFFDIGSGANRAWSAISLVQNSGQSIHTITGNSVTGDTPQGGIVSKNGSITISTGQQ